MAHPIVEQITLSQEQRPAVEVRGQDMVVTAGAGSGKTRTLVARYLALLADGLPLRGIVAITFTRKAAREMRNRVRHTIHTYLTRHDLPPTERARWQDIYAQLDAARIGTIHSLCAELLRSHPAEAGIDPLFDVLEEGQGTILRQRAVQDTLAWAADTPDVAPLFPLLGEDTFRRALHHLLGQRLDAVTILDRLALHTARWEERARTILTAFVDDTHVRALFADLARVRKDGTLERAAAAGDALADPLRKLLHHWDEALAAREREDWAALSTHLSALVPLLRQKGRKGAWQPHDPKAIIKALRSAYEETFGALVGRKGINYELDRTLAEEVLPRLRRAFQFAHARYEHLKRERKALDFDDLEAGALHLLEHHPRVRARWQDEVRAILVDEFQDTNARQRDIIRLLNGDGGKVFIVGDAKQSIYRFRGADVTVFRQEREAIRNNGGTVLTLATSYRAHKDLLHGLNALLRPVLGEAEDPERPWREPFAALHPFRDAPAGGFAAPYIELHLAVGTKERGALERAADALASRLVQLVEAGERYVERGGERRPLTYGDIAILCRSTRSFTAYEDALERAGIPFLTVAGRGFYNRPEVRDLLNALDALADPTNDLALVGLLRSPAFALSDAALFHLAAMRPHVLPRPSLWEVLQQKWHHLPADEQPQAQRAVETIARLHALVGRAPVADVLKALLDETDYLAGLLRAGEHRALRNVAKLLEDAHASGLVTVREFLEYIQALRETGVREGEARTTDAGAVQILTVHAAKGLEFPVVVIGDATAEGSGSSYPLLLDPDLGFLLPLRDEEERLPLLYTLGLQRERDQDAAESDRLLYVAATRAREMLLINGVVGVTAQGKVSAPKGWLGRLALALSGLKEKELEYDEDGERVHTWTLDLEGMHVACHIYEPHFPRRRSARTRPASSASPTDVPLLPTLAPDPTAVDEKAEAAERTPPQRVWRVVPTVERPRAPAWVVGALVHQALAVWYFPDENYPRWAEALLRGLGLTDPRQVQDAVARSRRMLQRFRGHPLFTEMDTADQRLHEVPYTRTAGDQVESGIIDVLYRRGDTWTLVEFKTDQVRDAAELNNLLATTDYIAQARRYVAAVQALLGHTPRARLCFLNVGGAIVVYDVQGDAPES